MLVAVFLATLVGCESSSRSSPPASPAKTKIDKDARADTILVYGVGYLTRNKLFDRFMNDRMYGNEIFAYAEAVLQTGNPGAVDSVLVYAQRYGSPSAIHAVVQAKRPEFGPWLEAHARDVGLSGWSNIGSTLAHNGWRDSVVAQVLTDQLQNPVVPEARSAIARAFLGMGTQEEVRMIVAISDTTKDEWIRRAAVAAQARFDVPEFNKSVRAALQDTSRLHTRMLEGLEENHRHDFLPELREVRETLDSKRPDYFLSYLDELIAELEENNEAGVSPGAPLDYPNTTRADSTAQ